MLNIRWNQKLSEYKAICSNVIQFSYDFIPNIFGEKFADFFLLKIFGQIL